MNKGVGFMNTYLYSIKMGFIFFPILAILITFPYIISQYRKYGSILVLRSIIIYSFVLYLLVIYFLVILTIITFRVFKKIIKCFRKNLIAFFTFYKYYMMFIFNIVIKFYKR